MGLLQRLRLRQAGDRRGSADSQGADETTRLIDAGNAAEDDGRIGDALASYDAAVRISPHHARAHLNRGNALASLGRHEDALAAYGAALAHRPDHAGSYVNIANLLVRIGRADEAVASYRRSLEIDQAPSVYVALALALQQSGHLDEAESALRNATAGDPGPGSVPAHTCLGNLLMQRGRTTEAIAEFTRAVQIAPDLADGHVSLGKALRELGRFQEALASFRQAVAVDAVHFEACSFLALTLRELRLVDEAIEAFEAALRLRPGDPGMHTSYGILLHSVGRLEDAIEHHRKALDAGGDLPEVRNSLGNALTQSGRLAEGIDEYRRAISARPEYWAAYSNVLFTMNYAARDASECFEMASTFGRALAAATPHRFASWTVDPRPERLRVGVVSGDLCGHPVGYFLESVLARLRESRIELFAYPTFGLEDALTNRIRPAFAAWKPLMGLGDEAAANLIRDDGVHVLLDLAGHTAHSRLAVFARKPAPVQASWLGYFATTGVDAMDYFVCDPYVAPIDEAANFTEQLWRLPDCYLCFTPPSFDVEVAPLPARGAGHVTFGCFNNLAKMNDDVVRLWARVLSGVPGAKLFLKANQLADAALRERTRNRFEAAGVSRSRLIVEGPSPRAEYLRAYGRVDIALDPFPYPGGTTTAEAYWMGVPTITRKGDRFLSRAGETFAHAAGMADWIAADDDEYVTKAAAFAADLHRLARIRASLRQQVLASPLFDAPRFARALEAALWGMWQSHLDNTRTLP